MPRGKRTKRRRRRRRRFLGKTGPAPSFLTVLGKRGMTGGALRRKRGPSLQDKLAYGISMALSGPAPSFFTAIGKLGAQGLKGILDNV